MDKRKYRLSKILNPWAGIVGYGLILVLIDGWATPILIGCVWLIACMVGGRACYASAIDPREAWYRQIRKRQIQQQKEQDS